MKIIGLNIEEYKHLKDLHFDFTYQSGSRKGEALDKVCFIGQSATGKTTLLNLILDFKNRLSKTGKSINGSSECLFKDHDESLISNVIKLQNTGARVEYNFKSKENYLYYFDSELTSKNIFNQNFNKNIFLENIPFRNLTEDLMLQNIISNYFIVFNLEDQRNIWKYIFKSINDYRQKLTQIGSDLVLKGIIADVQKFAIEMKEWNQKNPNPLIEIAEKILNPILKKLQLEVHLSNTSELIPLKRIGHDEVLPLDVLSTGTMQLLMYALPLFKLPTENSIILIDEPERSLYPDLQIDLINYFTNLAPKAQFFVATHSPFIAAAFEPEERFILYFEPDGEINFRRGVAPIGDDPNDILDSDFGLESIVNNAGVEAYRKYQNLLSKMQKENDPIRKDQLLHQVTELGEIYNF